MFRSVPPSTCWLEKKSWEVAGGKIIVVVAKCFQSPRGASPRRNIFVVTVIRSQCTLCTQTAGCLQIALISSI